MWDGRTGARICKLRGHSGNVRCAALSGDGRLCLTGSSDHTLRLWDLGQQRCVQTVHGTHHCSVWSVAMDASWHVCYSGGADGGVYATDLAHRRSAMLFEEEKGVLSLTLDDSVGAKGVWAATMGCGIRRWRCDVDWRNDEHAFTPGQRGGPGHRLGSSRGLADVVSRNSRRAGRRRERATRGGARTRGRAPTRSTRPPRRRSSPPRPSSNTFKRQTDCASSPPTPTAPSRCGTYHERVRCFDAARPGVRRQGDEPAISVPSWFTVDTRSGSIVISLMPSELSRRRRTPSISASLRRTTSSS